MVSSMASKLYMKPKDRRILIFKPVPGATPDEVMQVLRMFVFQSYPPELRTRENMLFLFDQLPDSAKRHFQVEFPENVA